MPVYEILMFAAVIGAGVGAHVALTLIGVEGIIASGASTILTMTGACIAGVVAVVLLAYGGGAWLSQMEFVQAWSNAATDWLVHAAGPGDPCTIPSCSPSGSFPAGPR